jgi:hypothetical protein
MEDTNDATDTEYKEEIKDWGYYGIRSLSMEEKYPVPYSDMITLNEYIDALLVDAKDGTDIVSTVVTELKNKVLPLVFHPVEFKRLHDAALKADLAYKIRHTPPNTCFSDSSCTIDCDYYWGALYSRLKDKITSMRYERALQLENKVDNGIINKEDVWFEYAFYKTDDIHYFKRVALQMRRMKDRQRGSVEHHTDINAWTLEGEYNTYWYETDNRELIQSTFPWGIGL